MANLLPVIAKQQKSAIIKADKFLNTKTKTTKVSDVKNTETESPKLLEDTLTKIERKVIQIDKLLKDSLFLSKKEGEKKRKGEEQKEFEGREKELEKKKPPKVKGVDLPTPPKMGFFDWIKNFITQTILGFIAVRLIDYLPTLLSVLPTIIKVTDFITDVGGKMLDGLITFIDWGYKAYDATRGFIKKIGGDGLAQNFDKFGGALNGLLDAAIAVGLASLAMGGGDGGAGGRGGRRGFDSTGRRVGKDVQRRYAQRFGKEQFVDRFGKKNLRNLSGGTQRGAVQKGARAAFMGLAGKQGAKAVLKFVKPLVSRIPIIGGLIEFGLSWALGEPLGKAAFRGIGSVLVGAIGTVIGGPVGAFLGSWAGGEAGGVLYDMFFGNKKVKPKGKVAKAAGGGRPATRGGKLTSGPAKRTIKKKKAPRTLRAIPSKLKPGGAIGGEKKIKKLYPKSKDKTKISPFDFLKDSYEIFARSTGLGALVALAIKPLMGDKPSYADYRNVGVGINNWMNQSVSPTTLAYAGGGEVRMESIVSGEDYSEVIAKSVQDSVAPEIDRTIQDLMKQLMLKEPERPKTEYEKQKEGDDTTPSLEVGPGGTVTGGNADFWALVAIASLESGTPQGRADVAQSIYNRLASGIYGGKTIKELIVSGNGRQYQPVGRAVREFKAISDKASAINAVMVANKLNKVQADKFINETAAAIQNKELQKSAAEFVGGRTDFWAQGLTPPSNGVGYVVRHGHRFGWFVGPAAIAYGKKNPGPAKAPALGDITVMGGSVAGGTVKKGNVVQWLHGTPGRPGYDPGHAGQANAHDHFSFKSRSAALAAFGALEKSGYKPYQFEGFTRQGVANAGGPGAHSASGGHYGPVGGKPTYSDMSDGVAFDIPWATYGSGPIGPNDYAKSLKAGQIVGAAFHGMNKFISKDGMLKVHKGELVRVVDKDSVDLFGKELVEDIISIENRAQLVARAPSIIEKLKTISGYTDYEMPYGGEPQIIEVPVEVPVPMPMGGGGSSMIAAGGGVNSTNDMFEQTLAQLG